jgi:hypothetical protein
MTISKQMMEAKKQEAREAALKQLEERAQRNPRRQFAALLVHALENTSDFEMLAVGIDKRGPLGGRSQQIIGVFVDDKGTKQGVVINAYVGEPDITIVEDGTVHPNGR